MPDSQPSTAERSPEYQELWGKYQDLLLRENESQERLRLLVESAVDYAIITLTPEGIINSWNVGAQRMFGWSEDEIIGQSADILFTPEDRAANQPQKELQTALREGRAADERYHVRKDGSRFYVSGVMTPLVNKHLHGFAKIARDLTRSKETETRLQEAHERTIEILESINDAFYAVDSDFRFIYINKKAEEVWGRSRASLLGQHFDSAFPQAVGSEVYQAHLRALATAQPQRLETLSPVLNQWIEVSIYPDGKEGLSVYFLNIDARKRAQEALRESEESLRLAIDAGNIGTCDWNYQTGIMRWNDICSRLHGLEPREHSCTLAELLSFIHPEDRERVERQMIAGIEERGEHAEEYRVVWADGSTYWLRSSGRVVERQDGKPLRIICLRFDITAQREAQRILAQSHEQLERRVEERTSELAQALQQVRDEMDQRRRAEEERAEMLRLLVNAQEEERGRVSRELHDNLGQHLTAVMFGLQALESQIGSATDDQGQQGAPQLDLLRRVVDGLMKAAHRQAWELRPAELDALGLAAALEQYVRDWTQRTQIPVDILAIGWGKHRPASIVVTTFYRVAQEALTNVARHSGATLASIILESNASSASLIVEDNGGGFDTEHSSKRLGLQGMRERLALIGGTLDIESSPENGTTIYARTPLQ